MCPGLVAKTCLSQKAVHSESNSAPVQVTIQILLSLFTAFLDPPSSLPNPPPPQLLSNNSSRTWTQHPISTGEGWWLTICNRVHLDSYRPLELRQTTVLEPLGRIWLMLWGFFRMWGGADGENLWVASSILIARWARGGRGGGGGREVHSW